MSRKPLKNFWSSGDLDAQSMHTIEIKKELEREKEKETSPQSLPTSEQPILTEAGLRLFFVCFFVFLANVAFRGRKIRQGIDLVQVLLIGILLI